MVSVGSGRAAGVSAAVEPLVSTGAAVAARLALEGTHPRHGAGTLQEGYIVYGQAPVKTRADRLKNHLEEGQRSGGAH